MAENKGLRRRVMMWGSLGGVAVLACFANLAGSRPRMLAAQQHTGGGQLLRQVGSIEVPGPKGKRFDYLTIDEQHRYLLSAHLGAGQLYVIDLKTEKLVKAVPDLPGIEGVEVVPDKNKTYTSDWWENKIGIVDLQQMKVVKKLPTESKPDGLTYAAPFHKVYVSDERGHSEAVVDTNEERVLQHLHFDSETGNVRYDPISKKVLVNLQDKNVIAVIDPATDKEVARYSVGKCDGNHGMALDAEHRRAFLSCEGNDLMTVFDLEKHQPIAELPMAGGADVVAFDPGLKRIYVACYSGAISVFQEDDADHFHKLGDVPVQRKVHSLAVDPQTHRVYAPEEEKDGRPAAEIAIYEAVR